ncbi:MAG: FAD-linked oxidase C-terminal domain-containing protein [Cyclobacteriaceae bacterium]|nr:FAD-linked oxidase C-terminal domain-containing protein [Cyclobacteriaceae bacterium]
MNFEALQKKLTGTLLSDEATRRIYATDASAYREIPQGVAIPANVKDIKTLILFAQQQQTSLIPRTAGTSLAGQVVGGGIIVDVSKEFNKIIEINEDEGWAWVEPGIVRDDLNKKLVEFGLFFAPETSTANRAMIGGMIGNNSCGANSVVYGSVREHLIEVKTLLSDGSEAYFGALDEHGFLAHCNGLDTSGDLHTQIYLGIREMLSDKINQEHILAGYPDPKIQRRNTGYAIDLLLRQKPFNKESQDPFNFASLIAGSEGTLAFITAAKIKLSKIPPNHKRLICIHNHTINESLQANLIAINYHPTACELMDHYILEATKRNTLYLQNRFFVQGDPKAILVVELIAESEEEVEGNTLALIADLKEAQLGYAFPVIKGSDISKVWGLRKAGLGLLSNVVGDAKAAPVVEDTAVQVQELPQYIADFNKILSKHNLYSVHYAHAGSGELHLRPILNLKTKEGQKQFRTIAKEIAILVKSYNGSLSGEHGDGRLRGEFIPQMLGEHNYQLCKDIKNMWDPHNIFNPGKVVNAPPMDMDLRFVPDQPTPVFDTMYDFSENQGIVRATELCNGSGDCRKTELSGGTMCPSYQATKDEKDTTRARANILREMLSKTDTVKPFSRPEIKEVLDLCLSCKGCSSECPSNVDMAKLKGEWQYQYYQDKGIPLRNRLIGNFTMAMSLASKIPWAYQLIFSNKFSGGVAKAIAGFAFERSMPALGSLTFKKWLKTHFKPLNNGSKKIVYLFCDEFTEYNDVEIGQKTMLLLDRLGYQVRRISHPESGRSFMSKGMLKEAKKLAEKNVALFSEIITEEVPLMGIEPSTILSFRDEYLSLTRGALQEKAKKLAKHVMTIEEFISHEIDKGRIKASSFNEDKKLIKVHGHCHQKSLSSMTPTKKILSLPSGHEVHMIPSGCCGMAGSFGYEKEHYALSMKIGELVLFPTVRDQPREVEIAAAGTSCRHQIKDGTGRIAKHPIAILYDALVPID